MEAKTEIRVTLSDALMKQLRKEAEAIHVPLQWLVAGLICDTVENCQDRKVTGPALCASR